MSYNRTIENMDVMDNIDISNMKPSGISDHSHIKQIRQFLLILICICLSFAVVYLIMSIIGWSISSDFYRKDERLQIIEGILTVVFYSFGLFVTLKYHQKGLRVYGWLGIILTIISIIVIIAYHWFRLRLRYYLYDDTVWLIFTYATSLITIWFHLCAITIVIIRYSFQLARLIEINRQSIIRKA